MWAAAVVPAVCPAALRAKIKLKSRFPPDPGRNRPENADFPRKMAIRTLPPREGERQSKIKSVLRYSMVLFSWEAVEGDMLGIAGPGGPRSSSGRPPDPYVTSPGGEWIWPGQKQSLLPPNAFFVKKEPTGPHDHHSTAAAQHCSIK